MEQACKFVIFNICYVEPIKTVNPIFGFAEFIAAFSLLMVLYTITDTRYKFRISVAPTSFKKISLISEVFLLTLLITTGTLLSDVWFERAIDNGWTIPIFLSVQAYWQGGFAAFFVILLLSWIWYAFIRPPVFSKNNYFRFIQRLYQEIVKGSEVDLPIIANELARSAKNIVKYSDNKIPRWQFDKEDPKQKGKFNIGRCAYELLLLIGNRKLCKYTISHTPNTAIAFFEEVTRSERYQVPLGIFATNIATEAFLNNDSILYHEDEGYYSGLIGYIKPFSKAVFGNCKLIGSLSHQSPFDIHYKIMYDLDSSQLKAYVKSFLLFVEDCLANSTIDTHSTIFNRTLNNITESCGGLYKLEGVSDFGNIDAYNKLIVITDFLRDLIKILNEKDKTVSRRKIRSKELFNDYHDSIACSMLDVIFNASRIKEPSDTNWWIQYSIVWNNFFIHVESGSAQKIIHHRLRRLIYSEIKQMGDFPNYKSIKILGFCLNVMGLKMSYNDKTFKALQKSVLSWTQKNYLKIREQNIDVVESGLMGTISFDEKEKRLVKTYAKGLNSEAQKDYLELKHI
jgi:hypothetical protein